MFKKLFKALLGSREKENPVRDISSPDQLNVNDIIVFKYRTELPESLREQSLTVVSICGYEYESGMNKEISLRDQHNNIICLLKTQMVKVPFVYQKNYLAKMY
jgi:hypothetical protein